MPTPNWGPQSGVSMDQATFDAYVVANPQGVQSGGAHWGGTPPKPPGTRSTTTDTVLDASVAAGGGGYGTPGNPSRTGVGDSLQGGMTDDYWRQFFMRQYEQQRPGVDFQTANQDQARLQQQQVIQDLQRAAAGDPNSLAQQQLGQAYQGAQSQQSSLGSTMRGQSAGAAMRGVQAGQQGIQRGLAGDQQMLQVQEQQAAQTMLAQMLAQQQGQDISQAQGVAAGVQGSQAMDDAMRQLYLGGAGQMDLAETERLNSIERARLGFADASQNLMMGLVKAGGSAAASAVGTASSFGGKQEQGGYRQVDGQNSIVPNWDK